ncbi:unnamed protein product, partial [Owenia fusiformis]
MFIMDMRLVASLGLVLLMELVGDTTSSKQTKGEPLNVRIATVLPQDPTRLFSIGRVRPALEIAIADVNRDILRPRGKLSVEYGDSQCSEMHGMNEAINFYMSDMVDVFFGPVCDFSLAPVARQLSFWNIPMITVGGLARAFRKERNITYPMLTRASTANFHTLTQFFETVSDVFKWKKLKILYEKDGQDNVLIGLCHLTIEAVYYGLEDEGFKVDYFKLPDNQSSTTFKSILTEQVGNKYA